MGLLPELVTREDLVAYTRIVNEARTHRLQAVRDAGLGLHALMERISEADQAKLLSEISRRSKFVHHFNTNAPLGRKGGRDPADAAIVSLWEDVTSGRIIPREVRRMQEEHQRPRNALSRNRKRLAGPHEIGPAQEVCEHPEGERLPHATE